MNNYHTPPYALTQRPDGMYELDPALGLPRPAWGTPRLDNNNMMDTTGVAARLCARHNRGLTLPWTTPTTIALDNLYPGAPPALWSKLLLEDEDILCLWITRGMTINANRRYTWQLRGVGLDIPHATVAVYGRTLDDTGGENTMPLLREFHFPLTPDYTEAERNAWLRAVYSCRHWQRLEARKAYPRQKRRPMHHVVMLPMSAPPHYHVP